MTFKFTFLDAGRELQCGADPRYPNGLDLDLSSGKTGCCFNTPYPAPRRGMMEAECETCGVRAMFTVAGRADDPRTLKLACRNRV
jgi:hypothetical protein